MSALHPPNSTPFVAHNAGFSLVRRFPVALFATVMGLGGLTLVWQKAETLLPLPWLVSPALMALTLSVLIICLISYAAKYLFYPEAVSAEFNNPVTMHFFPAISISVILAAMMLTEIRPVLSTWLWIVGAIAHLTFAVTVMSIWINHEKFNIEHINPAWFIPIVGNIIVPISGVAHGYTELSWFFFSIGIVFWLVLMTMVFYRFIFHRPLAARLVPTTFILLAPPSVGSLAWIVLSDGAVDNFARVLYYTAVFVFILLMAQIPRFANISFSLSCWAFSFPFAAFTVATLTMANILEFKFFYPLSYGFLAMCTVLIFSLVALTIRAMRRGEVFVAE